MSTTIYHRLDAALRWAAELHAGQFRDGDHALPYITHPFEVVVNLRNVGGVTDEDMLCAAALHDAIEECDVTAEEISERCGPGVARLVVELTREEPDANTMATMDKDALYELRNGLLLRGIREMSKQAMAIKLSDRLANLTDARRTRSGKKLERYVVQSFAILEIIPESVNPALWKAVRRVAKGE